MQKKMICTLVMGMLWMLQPIVAQAPKNSQNQAARAIQNSNPVDVVLEALRAQELSRGYSSQDFNAFNIESQREVKSSGLIHLYLKQTIDGIGIYNAIATGTVDRNGKAVHVTNRFLKSVTSRAAAATPRLTAEQAIARGAELLGLEQADLRSLEVIGGPERTQRFEGSNLSLNPIKAHLTYYEKNNRLELAWEFEIMDRKSSDCWFMLIAAETGQELLRQNLTVYDSFPRATQSDSSQKSQNKQLGSKFNSRTTVNDGSAYYVVPQTIESPIHGNLALAQNPADADASPFGWHDTNGVTGPEFTITRGNNVHAFEDRDGNQISLGNEPNGGSQLQFNIIPDFNLSPSGYSAAATVNLFFWNNLVHDLTYHYGFNEAAGNFQTNNYGNGGLGNDAVNAHAQSGAELATPSLNNANFATPSDGSAPRMRMYEWTSPDEGTVTAPNNVAGTYTLVPATFGPQISSPLAGDLQLSNDGTGTTTDGCEALASVAGKIAVIDRGSCAFVVKVENAQNAGAIAVIVVNNAPYNVAAPMGGTSTTITIPSWMIGKDDGDLLKAALINGDTVSISIEGDVPYRDSDYDSGIIAHEYGHGVSNRFTGGPSASTCLQNEEQAGEGWSDFLGLVLTAQINQTGSQLRAIGNYASFYNANGPGIRPTPYSTDMKINPSTYDTLKDTAGISVPHGVGYVFATMLWEVYWNLVDEYGFDPDLYNGTGGNNIAINLVLQGLAMQPCSPGFIDARNAILAADQAIYSGANQCLIWKGFAKRGLGFSATQGSSSSREDGTEAFDLPLSCSCSNVSLVVSPEDQEACLGDTVVFSVSATGTDLTYQWRKDQGDLNGETGSSLTLTDVTSSNDGTYTCVVSNTCSSEETADATLTVYSPQTYNLETTSEWPSTFSGPGCEDTNGNAKVDLLDLVDMVNRANS